ncbi:MAG TPA: LytTR family DNA-binding domain-containing protein [Chryseolinea sp.]|nr:LytTR family DNA-binding domain-containing protein [Chryseolinea sp.]
MKCLIIDDEPLARELMESYVKRMDKLTLVKSCNNALEAFPILHQKQIDLIFLDIQMPQLTGIDLIKSLKDKPKVILTTAYREYAAEAFDLEVIDYLVKPITFERFLRAVGKVYPSTTTDETIDPAVKSFQDAYIYLRENREMVKVFLKDIIYIESLRDYVRVKTATNQIVTYQKISFLEQKLPENEFVRIHRSFIVAVDKVSSFTFNSVKTGDIEIPLGRNYKQQALKVLNRNNALKASEK